MRWADGCKVMLSGHKTRECSPAWPPGSAAQKKKHASHNGGREIRVSSHLIWKQTCCCCAMPPPIMAGRPMPYPLGHGAACIFFSWAQCGRFLPRASARLTHANARHWALSLGALGECAARRASCFWARATSVKICLALVPFACFQTQKPRGGFEPRSSESGPQVLTFTP